MGIYKFQLHKTFRHQTQQVPDRKLFPRGMDSLVFKAAGEPWLHIEKDGTITVNRGYAWDGCSPKFKILDLLLVGTPDGIVNLQTGRPKTYYASLVHDALYQFLDDPHFPFSREQCDQVFLELLKEADFKLAFPYYWAVKYLGGAYRWVLKYLGGVYRWVSRRGKSS